MKKELNLPARTPSFRRCSKCGIHKPLGAFYGAKREKDGMNRWCKDCVAIGFKNWYSKNKEKDCSNGRKWHNGNKEKARVNWKKWYSTNKEKRKEYRKEYVARNKEQVQLNAKKWRTENPRRHSENYKRWYSLNKKHRLEYCAIRNQTARGRLNCRMGSSIWRVLREKKKNTRWETLVGYTADDLKKHLESQFRDGMSWENMGKWHIDHIVPISRFNYKTPEDPEFKICWGLNNLQPMWKLDNLSKNNRTMKEWKEGAICPRK